MKLHQTDYRDIQRLKNSKTVSSLPVYLAIKLQVQALGRWAGSVLGGRSLHLSHSSHCTHASEGVFCCSANKWD